MKFKNIAEIGDTIRVYDFQAGVDRSDCFIEGVVVGIGIDTVVIVSPPQAPGPVNRIDDSDLLRLVQARPKGQSIREAAAAALVAEDRHIPVATLEAATRRIQRKLRAAACKPVAPMSSRRG